MKNNNKKNINILTIIIGILLAIYSISLFIPMIWGFLTSLKDKLEFRRNMFGLPEEWLFSNYMTVLKVFMIPIESGNGTRNVFVLEMLKNSILYALGCALIQTMVQFIMSYIASRFKFKICSIIYGIVIFALAFPIVGSNASGLYIAKIFHLNDSILGMYIMKSYFLGLYFLIFFAQLKSFPKDFAEAAYLDGANNFTVMFKITLPMIKNTFLTIVLLLFITYWNDYTTPMLYMPNIPTLSYGLYYYNNVSTLNIIKNVPMRLAACCMMMLPILVLFIIFNKKLIGNVTMGGLKE